MAARETTAAAAAQVVGALGGEPGVAPATRSSTVRRVIRCATVGEGDDVVNLGGDDGAVLAADLAAVSVTLEDDWAQCSPGRRGVDATLHAVSPHTRNVRRDAHDGRDNT